MGTKLAFGQMYWLLVLSLLKKQQQKTKSQRETAYGVLRVCGSDVDGHASDRLRLTGFCEPLLSSYRC